MSELKDWQATALSLRGKLSSRAIAEIVGKSKSGINDFFNRYDQQKVTFREAPQGMQREEKRKFMSGGEYPYYTIKTAKEVGENVTHLMIPDTM